MKRLTRIRRRIGCAIGGFSSRRIEIDYQVEEAVRESARKVMGMDFMFVDDDIVVLQTLAQRAIIAKLHIDGKPEWVASCNKASLPSKKWHEYNLRHRIRKATAEEIR